MNKTIAILAAVTAGLSLAGCTTTPKDTSHQLSRKSWQLHQVTYGNSRAIKLTAAEQARHQLDFNRDGSLSLALDCNRGNGDWSASKPSNGKGRLTIGRIASTRALCPPPSYGEALAADLPEAKSFDIHSDGRALTIQTRQSVYSFVAADRIAGGSATHLPGDALVPGTGFHATAQVECSFNGGVRLQRCAAGVRRNQGPDGTTFVEVTKPNGSKRVLYFRGTRAYGADSAQSDGSAGFVFESRRQRDETWISYGPERYAIPDAFVIGG